MAQHGQPAAAAAVLRRHHPFISSESICYPFDPAAITVRDNGTATSEMMPEPWAGAGCKQGGLGCVCGTGCGRQGYNGRSRGVGWGSGMSGALRRGGVWFVLEDGHVSTEGLNEDEVVVTTCGGKGMYSFVMTDGRCGVYIGGVFVGFIGDKNEVGFKIGALTFGVTTIERLDGLEMGEVERLVGVEMEAM